VLLWLLAVSVFYWSAWHCGYGATGIWCPATVGGDYGLDAEGLAERVLVPGLGLPLVTGIVIGVWRRLRA